MPLIGPQIPSHLLDSAPASPSHEDESYGPRLPSQAGPQLPPHSATSGQTLGTAGPPQANPSTRCLREEDEEDVDPYLPALPPDLVPPTRILGPSFPQASRLRYEQESQSDSDDDVGPMPAPAGTQSDGAGDAVHEFMEREERRRKADEEARKPKRLEREEWMLVPPSNSSVLGSLDPTKLKARQFSRSANPALRTQDNSLWTETPVERQARLKDEVEGKRKRATDVTNEDADDTKRGDRKRSRYEAEVRAQVEEYNRQTRAHSLVDLHHSDKDKSRDKDDGPPVIWDHARDMSVGGRLMDDGQRSKMINEARGLGDRFGKTKSGGWL